MLAERDLEGLFLFVTNPTIDPTNNISERKLRTLVVSRKISSVICVNRQVHIHPVSRLDGSIIREIYGHDLDLVRHDHICSAKGHIHG